MIDLRLGNYADTLSDAQADLILTSPPYNIGSKSPAKTGKRNAKAGTYDPKSYRGIREYADNLPEAVYQQQQIEFLDWCAEHLNPGGVVVYNHKLRRKNRRMVHPMEWIFRSSLDLMDQVVWDRGSTHNHCPQMMWQHTEYLFVLHRPGDHYPLKNTAALKFRNDVWRIPRAPVNGHNAPFPEMLAEAVINAWSRFGGVVMDPYSGSGTTAVVAKRLGRHFVGSEIKPEYYEQAIRRAG
jgi:DNA modification methylase